MVIDLEEGVQDFERFVLASTLTRLWGRLILDAVSAHHAAATGILSHLSPETEYVSIMSESPLSPYCVIARMRSLNVMLLLPEPPSSVPAILSPGKPWQVAVSWT